MRGSTYRDELYIILPYQVVRFIDLGISEHVRKEDVEGRCQFEEVGGVLGIKTA